MSGRYSPLKFVIVALFILFIFIEEIIYAPLRKIKILVVERTIKRMSPFVTLISITLLKLAETSFKFLIPYYAFKGNSGMATFIVFLDVLFGFISVNILIYGWENLRQYAIFRIVSDWIVSIIKELKSSETYIEIKLKYDKIKKSLSEFRIKIFGEHKTFFRKVRIMLRRLMLKYKRKRDRKSK